MNIGVYGDSWAWDWTRGPRNASSPSEFCKALKSHGHTVTNYCQPATCLNVSKTIITETHEQHDCVVVFATCPYRIFLNTEIECLDGIWITSSDPHSYHERLHNKFKDYTPQQHTEWCEQIQREWQQALPQGKTIVLGGAGPIRQLLHPGINHVKAHLSTENDYTLGYHSQCYGWAKATINTQWNPQSVAMIADHLQSIEEGSVGDQYHLLSTELVQLAHSVNSLINNIVLEKP